MRKRIKLFIVFFLSLWIGIILSVNSVTGNEKELQKSDFPRCIYIKIEDLEIEKIIALYQEEEENYVFCLPAMSGKRKGNVVAEFWDGSQLTKEVSLPCKEQLEIEKNGHIYEISFWENENTPTVFLDTGVNGGFAYLRESKENELPGIIRVLDENGRFQYVGEVERIRGRGNDSWLKEKQGFGFKLKKNGNILEMGNDKDYALLPGYRNASLLTYQVVWDMSRRLEWENALEGRMVQFYGDGEYWGLYFLTEKVESGKVRIPIGETREINSGFVFEYSRDDYKETDVCFETEHNKNYVMVSPSQPTPEQTEYCLNYWNELEAAVYSESGYNEQGRHYTEYLDLESWAAQWLYYEINGEFSTYNSVFYYKDAEGTKNDKIKALFPWDVEQSFLNFNEDETARGSYAKTGLWRALGRHEEFRMEVRRQWEIRFRRVLEDLLKEDVEGSGEDIKTPEYYVKHLEKAFKLNELRWGEEQDMAKKAQSIHKWMELTIPYLDVNLYRDEFFAE